MPDVASAGSPTDAGLASELRFAVMRLRRRLALEFDPDNELGFGAMAVLGALHRHGAMSIGELARFERVKPPSMTRTVNCLQEGGFVERRAHESDGRQVLVCLTERGRRAVLADRARRDAWLGRQLDQLNAAERDTLLKAVPLLERLATSD